MADVTERQILDALGRIRDPQRGGDIVSLGMVAGLVIRNGNVGFAIEVDAERGPALEPLRQAAEKAVEALPGVLSVTAVLTAQAGDGHRSRASAAPRPGTPDSGRHDHAHHDRGHSHAEHGHHAGPAPVARGGAPAGPAASGAAKAMVPGVQAIVAVASGKGGVGKSTVAANLALALKANGLSVGILDADIYGPSVPRMLGISGRPDSDGKKLKPMESFGLRCMSMGFLVPEDTAMIWRGPMVMSALQQMLRDVSWGTLDILVVDMPPGTGDAQLTMAQSVPLAGAVIVSTPQDIALIDARRGLNMFRKVDVPVLGIVENMSYFLCPHCGERSEVFSHGGARLEAQRMGVEFLGEVPLDLAIRETSDGGQPIVSAQPDGPHAKLFRRMAERVWAQVAEGGSARRQAPRIVVE